MSNIKYFEENGNLYANVNGRQKIKVNKRWVRKGNTMKLESVNVVKDGVNEIVKVLGCASHPRIVLQNNDIDKNNVILNVQYKDGTTGTTHATLIIADTTELGRIECQAWYDTVGYITFPITVK